jgi:hypothetical protein
MNYDRFIAKKRNKKCSHCKCKKYRYDSSKKIAAFLAENEDKPTDISGTTPALNFGFLVCENCGHVKLFSEIKWEEKNDRRNNRG